MIRNRFIPCLHDKLLVLSGWALTPFLKYHPSPPKNNLFPMQALMECPQKRILHLAQEQTLWANRYLHPPTLPLNRICGQPKYSSRGSRVCCQSAEIDIWVEGLGLLLLFYNIFTLLPVNVILLYHAAKSSVSFNHWPGSINIRGIRVFSTLIGHKGAESSKVFRWLWICRSSSLTFNMPVAR